MLGSVLVTGGAGFIGSHLVDALVDRGARVRVLDNLDAQVHGNGGGPELIAEHVRSDRVEFLRGDVRDPDMVDRALEGVDAVFHQAAAVGVGQSMYRIADYVASNSLGAAVLLERIIARDQPLEKMVVASSMSIYGEGKYECPSHGTVHPGLRSEEQFRRGQWEVECPECGAEMSPMPTDEAKRIEPTSVYAITKRDHEELFLTVGDAYEIPTVALRYFNVYGPRQSLDNPYTGVAAIFTSRLLNDQPPIVFEDGQQSRDFVHVSDIARANLLALESDEANGRAYNVGTGRRLNLLQMIDALRDHLGGPEPEIVGEFRKGDIRYCYADVSRISEDLGFEARVPFEDGIDDLASWASEEEPADRVEQATEELKTAGLTV